MDAVQEMGPDDFGLMATPKGIFLFHENPQLDRTETLVVRKTGIWAELDDGARVLLGGTTTEALVKFAAAAVRLKTVVIYRPSAEFGGEAPIRVDP